MKHILIKNDNECYGCRACENICPKNAICMIENKEGFLYPKVDEDKCINCGLCLKACPSINKTISKNSLKNSLYYAAKAKNKQIQRSSTSGGIFSVIANYVISKGGLVYGAEMDKKHLVHHVEISSSDQLKRIMGSKYVYSDLKNIFITIKNNLEKNKLILFSGVPCQIAALKLFLSKDYNNLLTVDVICHGTPNQKLFDKYICFFEDKYKLKVLNYEFRSKKHVPWGKMSANVVCIKDGKIINKQTNSRFDWYYNSFLTRKNYRETCYSCKFASKDRVSDLTLGDFWGIENVLQEFNDPNGVSCLIISTQKGKQVFKDINKNIDYIKTDYELMANKNEQLKNPSKRPLIRNKWYNDIDDFRFVNKKYISFSVICLIKRLIPKKLKKYIKKYSSIK